MPPPIHLHNHAAGNASGGQPAVVGVRAVPQGCVIGKLLARGQNRTVDLGQGQGHIAVAVGRVGGHSAVGGQLGEVLLQIGLGHLGLCLHKGGLHVSPVLLRKQLANTVQGLDHVHPSAFLLLGKGKRPAGPIVGGHCGVLGLGKTGGSRLLQLLLPCLGKVNHIVQRIVGLLPLLQKLGNRQFQSILHGKILPGEENGVVLKLHRNLQSGHLFFQSFPGHVQSLFHGFPANAAAADGSSLREQGKILHLGGNLGGLRLLFLLHRAGAQPAYEKQRDSSRCALPPKGLFLIQCHPSFPHVFPIFAALQAPGCTRAQKAWDVLFSCLSLYLPPRKK